ncbi:unnamed protein product [Adineta steineri]|uniref:Uncharacterized protein n=1 Tax=Adineta steineri TaxID=433720 RepID=A0A815MYW5_9BILA|nr:unnamed protein product [Adineta steineri]CAF1426722.1 unnamed protein product [Adineta steineri]CAF1429487.1 unnamed protein product [Adineta steineri]
MSDERNLPNNDNENQQLGVENEYNSTVTNDEQSIALSQIVTDEINIDPHGITDQQINTLIVYPRNYFKEIIISLFLWIFIFFHRYINQFLHLLIFSKNYIITHLFGTYEKQYDIESHETQPGYSELPYPLYRDAEAEGRSAHPTDEPVTFSLATTIVEVIDAEFINADEHNIHVNLNDVPYIQPVLNNENGNFIPLDIQNAPIGHDIADEDTVSQDAIDNPTCNINPVRSVQSQDNISSDNSSDDECTSSCQSGFDSDDEDEISDDDLQTGAVLLVNDDIHTNVQDNSLSSGENLVHEQTITTGTSSNEVIETIENVTTITESSVYFDRIPVIDLPKILVPKVSGDIQSSDGIEEESII